MSDFVIPEKKRIILGNLIRQKREESSYGLNQLATDLEITSSLLSKLENGLTKKINPFLLKKVGNALNIDYKELYKIVDYLSEEDFDQSNIDLDHTVDIDCQIPVYESVSAGTGGIEYGELIEHIQIPHLKNCTEVFGVKVKGDSMEYTIPNGATIIVKKDVEVMEKEIGVFIVNNEPFVKRLKKDKNYLMLLSDNIDYDPILVTEHDELFIVGKVLQVMYSL